MMIVLEMLILIAASAAIVAAVGGLVYIVVLTGLEESDRHRHTLANAEARRARTQSQLPQREPMAALRMLAGRTGA